MPANRRPDVVDPTRTATPTERQSLDTFDTIAAKDETGSATTTAPTDRGGDTAQERAADPHADQRATEPAAVPKDGNDSAGQDRGDEGERVASTGSGLTAASGTPDRGSSVNQVVPAPADGGEDSTTEPHITLGTGSDSRSDLNMLTTVAETPGASEGETDGTTTETSSGIRVELDDTDGGGSSREGDTGEGNRAPATGSLSPDAPSVLETSLPADFRNLSPATRLDESRAGDGGRAIDVFDSVTAIPTPIQPVDGPSNIPGRDSLLPDRAQGESAPGSLRPELTAADALSDQFGLSLQQDSSPKGFYGDQSLELPETPTAGGLPERGGLGPVDVGVDFANLGGSSTLDGRTHDTFDGVRQGAPATGPADPTDMISSGGEGQKGSVHTTNADSDMAKAEADVDALIKGIQEGTKPNPYISIQLELEGSVVDVPADVELPAADPVGATDSKSNVEIKKEQWNYVGEDVPQGGHTDGGLPAKVGETTWLEGIKALFKDEAEADLISPSEGGLGSAPTTAINQSLLIGLGGQRGGTIDPQDDTEPATSGEMIYDPYNSVVDPGEDHFESTFRADSSMIPGPMESVAPELADE